MGQEWYVYYNGGHTLNSTVYKCEGFSVHCAGVQCALWSKGALRKFRITRDFSVTCLALTARPDSRGFEVQTKGVSWCDMQVQICKPVICMFKFCQVQISLLVNATPACVEAAKMPAEETVEDRFKIR